MIATPLPRPEPITVRTTQGIVFVVRPCSRVQMRSAIALDPASGELGVGPSSAMRRRARQLAALVGSHVEMLAPNRVASAESEPLLAALTPTQEAQLLAAILASLSSDNVRRVGIKRPVSTSQRLTQFDADTLALSLHLNRTPSDVERAVGFVESIAVLEAVYRRDHERARFEASLHGLKLS